MFFDTNFGFRYRILKNLLKVSIKRVWGIECFPWVCWQLDWTDQKTYPISSVCARPSSCCLWTAWSGTTSSSTTMARTSTPSTPTLPPSPWPEDRRSSWATGSTSSSRFSLGEGTSTALQAAFLFQLLLLLQDYVVLLHSCLHLDEPAFDSFVFEVWTCLWEQRWVSWHC